MEPSLCASLLLRRFVFRMAEASAKRVTGDEPQGLSPSRLPLRAHRERRLGTRQSLRGKKDGEGELQLWYRAMFNDCRILYASRIAGHDEMVCELLMFFLFHFRDCTDKISKIKTLSTKKSKLHFVQY